MTNNHFEAAAQQASDRGEHATARRLLAEGTIALAITNAILGRDMAIDVFDGEEWVGRGLTKTNKVMALLAGTDEDIIAGTIDDGVVCWFHLVYGNDGYDVVHDHTANTISEDIWKNVIRPLTDKLEKEA